MRIRNAVAGDLPSLVLLFEAYRAFYEMPPAAVEASMFLSQRITSHESQIFVAEDDTGSGFGC
jgi:hypothetical protein